MVWGSEFNLARCFKCLEMSKISDSGLDSFPDDMLIQILIRIPPQEIHDSVMFVCRKLYHTIRSRRFVYAHLYHSTPVLLFQKLSPKRITTVMSSSTQGDQFEISDFSCNLYLASCNGLLLGRNDHLQLTITNPVTKQRVTLPPFKYQYSSTHSAIAYAAARMEYKVVRTYDLRVHETYNPMAPKYLTHKFCAVLTVGVDKYSWRHVDTGHLSRTTSAHLDFCPLVTEGYVHWTKRNSSPYVLTLNIETEIITRIPVPPCKGRYHYLAGGSYLSLLICRALFKWEVWEMKPETGEWKKLSNIDLEAHKALLNEWCDQENDLFKPVEGDFVHLFTVKPNEGDYLDCHLAPKVWLKYREVIVFGGFRPDKGGCYFEREIRVVYNIQTRDISLFKLGDLNYSFLIHRKSLVRIP